MQWRIQLWADRAAAPLLTKLRAGLGCTKQSASDAGKFSFKSLTFGHFLNENGQKAFSLREAFPPDPLPGALPFDPT